MTTKICTVCRIEKPIEEFSVEKRGTHGRRGNCKDCDSIRKKKYYEEHKEELCKNSKEYYSLHKEKCSADNRKWRENNIEKDRERQVEWRKNNPNKVVEYGKNYRTAHPENIKKRDIKYRARPEYKTQSANHSANRRAKKGDDKLSKDIVEKLMELQKGKCVCCRKPLGNDYHIDHIIPLKLGGKNVDSNIQLLRAKCNMQKSAKHPVDFMQSRGFLL